MDFPPITLLRQKTTAPAVDNLPESVRRTWLDSRLRQRLNHGDRVAVAVGSRGIANIATIVRATLQALGELGAKPFVVAAMGSHGGGTAEGQRRILADYGVSEEALGVPVKTAMDVVQIGINSWDEPVYWDKNAWEADAVVTVSRVKPHTDFHGRYESGIVKMLAIGLGKREGAAQHHRWGVRGLSEMMPETARLIIEKSRFAAGLAILENSREETAHLRCLDREEVLSEEPRLLENAKRWIGRLPFDQLDLLVIGEIGKNYSGAGIDPNVVGRLLMEGQPEPESPRITRICALDLSPESHGNGTGIGIADLTTDRAIAAIDPAPTRLNSLTACCLWRSKLPFSEANDRDCIEMGLKTCWQPDRRAVRMAIIPNTLEVSELWVSPPLAAEARKLSAAQLDGDSRLAPFDGSGNLRQEELFPHSVRARRGRPAEAHILSSRS